MRPKKVILLVDGDECAASVRKYLFETLGYRVHTVHSGQAAIERFSQIFIDVVLARLELPGMDGNALMVHLNEIASEPVMLLFSDLIASGGCAHQADGFLGTGTSPKEFVERVRMASARKRGPKKKPAGSVSPEYFDARGIA